MRLLVLVLHVLGAVVALGFSLSYGLWASRGEATGPAERAFALRTISWIDRRLTTPAYVVQLVTGLTLVGLTGWGRLKESWLILSIGLYVLLTVLAITTYAPAHRRRREVAERIAAGEQGALPYDAVARTARRIGTVVVVLTLTIAVLMVWKPHLW